MQVFKNIAYTINKNSPVILTGISIVGVLSTTALAIKHTPKALQLIEEEKIKRSPTPIVNDRGHIRLSPDNPLKLLDYVKLTWKCYVPAAVMGGFTIGCILSNHNINTKRNAALVSMYSLAQGTFKEYQHKVIETLGEKKEKHIRSEIKKDHIKKKDTNQVIITGKGDVLCYDVQSGRYFKNDIENIRRIENDLNRSMMTDMFIPLNDIYYAWGLEPIKIGDEFGWHIDSGLIAFRFDSHLKDGVPCLVIDYDLVYKH